MVTLVATVIIETDDPRLCPATINPNDRDGLRQAVLAALPTINRVIAIQSEADAQLMFFAHDKAKRAHRWPRSPSAAMH